MPNPSLELQVEVGNVAKSPLRTEPVAPRELEVVQWFEDRRVEPAEEAVGLLEILWAYPVGTLRAELAPQHGLTRYHRRLGNGTGSSGGNGTYAMG